MVLEGLNDYVRLVELSLRLIAVGAGLEKAVAHALIHMLREKGLSLDDAVRSIGLTAGDVDESLLTYLELAGDETSTSLYASSPYADIVLQENKRLLETLSKLTRRDECLSLVARIAGIMEGAGR
ncbi:MAG: hypothetical protein DSY37_02750 [Hyperthermus sp.]|nr:MAG: hypothetical protein DSY37_02750 [Hyperthermus sp.]